MLSGIDHVVLLVSDLERAVDWYVEHFDVPVERLDLFEQGTSSFVSLRISPSCIIDLLPTTPSGCNADHVALTTDRASFDAFVDRFRPEITMGPKYLSGAQGSGEGIYLRDPDGNGIELRTYG